MRLTDLDLNLLKSFVTVAEETSFTRAAKKLFVEQSAVSKAIKRLEYALEATLFLRTKRHVQLTSQGAELLNLARGVLQSADELLKTARNQESELSGTLKFGAMSPLSYLFMPEVILKIAQDYPKLWPMMFTGISNDLTERVKSRELEFAVLTYEGTRVRNLEYRELGMLNYRIVAAPKIKPARLNSFIGSREIEDQNSPQLPTFERLRKLNSKLKINYSANDPMAYRALVLAGLGIGVLPELMVRDDLRRGKLRVFQPAPKLTFPVHLIYHASYPLSLEAQRLITLLKGRL